tara:strand:- start:488 stop:1396 length:909 start_codon:yes stop_codon:yes gene_type:complete
MSENTELTTATEGGTALSIFTNTDSFELAQRAGKMLASSDLVPKQFQNNIPNCVIALNIASRLGADPFAVLQSLYIVHGRPAWSSQFLIAMVNASGRYSPLQFRMTGQGDSAACVAWARHLETDEVVEGPEVSIAMAKAEGWYGKAGSKWVTLPKLMLMYRSAGFFARLYCPDLCLGMRTMEEESDIGKTTQRATPSFTPAPKQEPTTTFSSDDTVIIDAEETSPETDPRADALSKVLELVTNSDATPDQIDTVLRGRGVLGETGTIPRLGEAKLNDIANEFKSIESEALALQIEQTNLGTL